MYLPKSRYTGPLNTPEGVYVREDGTPFKGWFFIIYDGRAYEGKGPFEAKEQLKLKVVYDAEQKAQSVSELKKHYPAPSQQDYNVGTLRRYFVKRKVDNTIVEVNSSTYVRTGSLPFYEGIEITWNLTGPVEDIKYSSYTMEGAASKNKKVIEQAEQTFKGLSQYLTDLGEFVK